jgi:hypothetical protein
VTEVTKRYIIALLSILVCSIGAFPGETLLPRLGAALTPANYQARLHELVDAGIQELVMPTIELKPGQAPGYEALEEYGKILQAEPNLSPQSKRTWLRFRLLHPDAAMSPGDVETAINKLSAELAERIKYPYAGIILDAAPQCPGDLVRLTAAAFSVSLKAVRENMQIAVSGRIAAAGGAKILAYIDRVVLFKPGDDDSIIKQLRALRMNRPISLLVLEQTGSDSRRPYLDSLFSVPAMRPDTVIIEQASREGIQGLTSMTTHMNAYLPAVLIEFDEFSSFVKLTDANGKPSIQAVFADELLSAPVILARVGGTQTQPRTLRFQSPEGGGFQLTCRDPLDWTGIRKEITPASEFPWPREYILLTGKKAHTASDRVGSTVSVSASVGLSAEEIAARWQQYDARQKKKIENYRAIAEMDMHFEPPGLGAGFDVSLHFQYFWNSDGTQYWEQTAQYLNGIKLRSKRSFPLPQLEPEQVVTQPLQLNLVESYGYRLEKPERINNRPCYVLSFRPKPGIEETLYTGKIWIDKETFRGVRMKLVQNNCSGSILSNVETQHFELLPGPGGGSYNLLVRSDVEQKVLAAGREFVLERRYRFKDIGINTADFAGRLSQAMKGPMPMFAETRGGLREMVIKKDGTRGVKNTVDSFIWSLVSGVLYDDTASFPIPFIGASAIDYDFLDTGMQLSALLVVPVLALNLSKQLGGNLTFGADLALSALPRNDRLFRNDKEVENQSVYIFSGSAGLRLGWQPMADLSITASGYLIYEHFLAQDNTAEEFILPRNGFTLNPNLNIDYSRKGYRLALSASLFNRPGWSPWGMPGQMADPVKTYAKFSGLLGKRFYLGSFTRIGADISYFTGLDLDRFSGYQPSLMSVPQIRGVPGGTVSLEQIGVLSLNTGFTILDFVRFDAYYNFARGVEIDTGGQTIDFQGLELDFGTVGPWDSYLQGRITYALAGPMERYQSRWGIYIMMFIPFK